MKKCVITLLVLLACTRYPVRAYEYFTIYFSDGTKSEAFYATDVDSICYSKLSLDSIEYTDWQVQEIYTCDSVYRYSLALIDSLSFKDVDLQIVTGDIANINCKIIPMYAKCNSTEEISIYIPEILNITGVENAWVDNQSLFVKVRNWGTLTFSYPPIEEYEDEVVSLMSRASTNKTTQYTNEYKACIINQMFNDQNRNRPRNAAKKLKSKFEEMGIDCYSENKPLAHFFQNGIFDYDLVFIMTHGGYDGQTHWLYTSEELFSTKDVYNELEYQKLDSLAYDLLEKKYPNYSPNMVNVGWLSETREGKKVIVWYVRISEHYIDRAGLDYKNRNTAIFNLACQSLKENSNLARVFLNKGAKCYLGYTESNRIGAEGGESFYNNLLNGKCAYGAKDIIPIKWCTESFRGVTPRLELWSKSTEETLQYNITKPETLTAETYETGTKVTINGQIKILNPYGDEAKDNGYGFLYSKSSDMKNYTAVGCELGYNDITHNVTMNYTLNIGELEPNTTYYYRAYMNDGYSDCYGEIKSFTTPSTTIPDENAEPYGIVSNDGTLLTYYYDGKKNEREGRIVNVPYKDQYIDIVSFDASFVNYKPTSTQYWFYNMSNLTSIQNIEYLNTSNVTDMSWMFYGCSSLKSLDLSSFNTSNVSYMGEMFYNCSSLANLDLSSFDTSNVSYMGEMFYNCSSLANLDLSSFDTSKVTDMEDMFLGCGSLKNLNFCNLVLTGANGKYLFSYLNALETINLNNANTVNATDMYGMFNHCNSLCDLDLSSFKTDNTINMERMFMDCSSLKSLDLSSFNTSNVTNMTYMFYGCSSLEKLNLSSFRTSSVTSFYEWFSGCNSLTQLDISNFDLSNIKSNNPFGIGLLAGLTSLRSITMNDFVFGNTAAYMFSGKEKLEEIIWDNVDTNNVTDMKYMFKGCSLLKSVDLYNFETKNVKDMNNMFYDCKSLNSLDVRSFNTSNVTNMAHMFGGCISLSSIDLENFDTYNVGSMRGMFANCNSLTKIYASDWNKISRVDHGYGEWGLLFDGCNKLEGEKGTKIGINYYVGDDGNTYSYECGTSLHYACVDGGKDNPGLFTAK